MSELLARPNLRAALRGSVEEEVCLLRELAFSLRTVAFASFQKRMVNDSPRTRAFSESSCRRNERSDS